MVTENFVISRCRGNREFCDVIQVGIIEGIIEGVHVTSPGRQFLHTSAYEPPF